ncbi:uncharacterized protein LOC112542678 [Python bivittatus]|uniref:Uncharacterized protein LOC112542678 n=1 Tax=Python bivittatus TaxID=176946 RepID=A0A9F5J3R4_PYTBI|nr:uncharacterized protein LOC112542678 [Python bivittatus]
MASASEEGPVGGVPFFIAVSLASACLVALCAACKRKDKSNLSSQDDDHELFDEAAGLRRMVPLAFGGSVPSLRHVSGRDSGDANQRPASLALPCPLSEDDGTVPSCSFIILPQRDLPTVPPSQEETYSNLNFPKRGEEMLCESKRVEGEERKNCHPGAEKLVEDAPGHQEQAAGPSYARVVKRKANGKQRWVDMGNPQETSLLPGVGLSPPTKGVEEMYSVVCKDKKKKKAQSPEGAGEQKAPQAEASPGPCQGATVSQESNGIASYQSSSFPAATEPCYQSIHCEPRTKAASQPASEPAYETVETYWHNAKKNPKASKWKTVAENLYESIDQVAFQGQSRGRASHLKS